MKIDQIKLFAEIERLIDKVLGPIYKPIKPQGSDTMKISEIGQGVVILPVEEYDELVDALNKAKKQVDNKSIHRWAIKDDKIYCRNCDQYMGGSSKC